MPSSGMLHRVALVTIDVLEASSSSIIRAKIISELGAALAATSVSLLRAWVATYC
jgi:hypothetical protein